MPYQPLRRGAGRLFDENLNRMLQELYAYWGLADFPDGAGSGVTVRDAFGRLRVSNTASLSDSASRRALGSSIAGVVDELVLCVSPLSANADIYGGITWRETA